MNFLPLLIFAYSYVCGIFCRKQAVAADFKCRIYSLIDSKCTHELVVFTLKKIKCIFKQISIINKLEDKFFSMPM